MFTLPKFFYFKIKFTLSVSNYKTCVRNVSARLNTPLDYANTGKRFFTYIAVW